MPDPPDNLEAMLKQIKTKANTISDETIKNEVLAEIERLRKEKTQKNEPQQRNTPKKEIFIIGGTPSYLTAGYDFIGWYTIHSDVYSTDSKPPFFWGQRWGELYKSGGSYDGCAANYIKNSLEKRIKEHAGTIHADLVIVQFTRKKPFGYSISQCKGLGRTNFQGQINAKFYKSK